MNIIRSSCAPLFFPFSFIIIKYSNTARFFLFFFLFSSFAAYVHAPSHNVEIYVRDGSKAGMYTCISPTESKQGHREANVHQIIAFFDWIKTERKPTSIGCFKSSQERKRERAERKKNRSERAQTHIAFNSFPPPTDFYISTKKLYA